MLQKSKYFAIFAGLLIFAVGGWIVFSNTGPFAKEELVDISKLHGKGVLDGMIFKSELGPIGKPPDIKDDLIFKDGMFVSVQCERQCNYPAQPYFVREKDGEIQFVSETKCLTKDAKLVWRGSVKGNTIEGILEWTANRWYWTVQKEFWFKGTIKKASESIASQ